MTIIRSAAHFVDGTPNEEVLSAFDRLARRPDEPLALRSALGAPPDVVARCLTEGLLIKAGMWSTPTLTDKGKALLRRWRTCWDCHEEIVEGPHDCPARRQATAAPYR